MSGAHGCNDRVIFLSREITSMCALLFHKSQELMWKAVLGPQIEKFSEKRVTEVSKLVAGAMGYCF